MLPRSATIAAALLAQLPAIGLALDGDTSLEHVAVTASQGRGNWGDQHGLASNLINPQDLALPAASMAQALQRLPGISYAGQGGLLQTLSVGGLSGQRVSNYWGDLPITSERRAGTSSSFIDPLMLNGLQVIRGPSSVHYGSGAVAGVIQLAPRKPQALEWQAQWESSGDENLQYIATGNQQASVAFSRRSANDSNSSDGDELHTQYDQYNAQLLWDFTLAGQPFSLQTLYSRAEDIGKSNNLYPDQRVTDYPDEWHWLGQISTHTRHGLDASLFFHLQELDTRVERIDERLNEVETQSLDWGFSLFSTLEDAPIPLRLGLDYLGRRNVESDETETWLEQATRTSWQSLDAEQDGVDIFLDSHARLGQVEFSGGLRYSWIDQHSSEAGSDNDSAPSVFLQSSWFANPDLEIYARLASGVRFASLSERFFSGTTGRSSVIGNSDLDTEETLAVEAGLSWQGARGNLDLRGYALNIDDYIERVELAPGLRSFENLTEGQIRGIELATGLQFSANWSAHLGGHYIEGEDDDNNNLADIPAPRINAGLSWQQTQWSASIDYQYRFSSGRVSTQENRLDTASLLDSSLSYHWPNGVVFSLWGSNLLDRDYRLSSDRLSTHGPQRSFGLRLAYTPH